MAKKPRYLAIFLLAVIAIGAFTGTSVTTYRFCPNTLTSNYSQMRVLPLIRIPIYHSGSNEFDYKLASYLESNGYWIPNSGNESFQQMACLSPSWRDGHSTFHAEFSWRAEDWISWTEKNPAIAAELWKNVLRNLRIDQHGDSIMELMYDAKYSTEPNSPKPAGVEQRG